MNLYKALWLMSILASTDVYLAVQSYTPSSSRNQAFVKRDFLTDGLNQDRREATRLFMKPKIRETPQVSTELRYRHLFQEDVEIDQSDWVGQWIANWQKKDKQVRTKSGVRMIHDKMVEYDEDMDGSVITHLSENDVNNGIEILPHNEPMYSQFGSNNHDYSKNGRQKTRKRAILAKIFRGRSRRPRMEEETRELLHSVHPKQKDTHSARVSTDLGLLAVETALAVETTEQWLEFSDNTGGLQPIVQCIHDIAEEIRGNSRQDSSCDVLSSDNMNKFHAACSACKSLRDLCSKDKNWSAAITEELLALNKDCTFISDLVLFLSHASEAERFSNRQSLRKVGVHPKTRKQRRDSRLRCCLYIQQLLLAMVVASDDAVEIFQKTPDLLETVRSFSSFTKQKRIRNRRIKYIYEKMKRLFANSQETDDTAFLAAASMKNGIEGEIQRTSNKLLAALGYNVFVPKSPNQKGLRILALDGGGTRGILSISMMQAMVDSLGGAEVCDKFDIICGTSTGAIIAFLVGLRRESNKLAKKRYDELIDKIFIKSSLSAPMLLFTTASYSEVPFKEVMMEILGENSMLDSRADPRVPLVFAVSAKMSSTTSKCCLFRNYNYSKNEKKDNFVVCPDEAKRKLGFPFKSKKDQSAVKSETRNIKASRHEGSFRVLQRAALRATTAAPTFFKPVMMGSEMYSDGGLIASNPTAIALHEARTLFPDVPIEMIVSIGTGEFESKRVSPAWGWDGIINQIVNSATDTAKTHWVLEDILSQGRTTNPHSAISNTKYYRFDPVIGTSKEFPIDCTDPMKLEKLSRIGALYMQEEEQQQKLDEMRKILSPNIFT